MCRRDSYLSSASEAEQNVVLGKQSSLGEWSSLTPKQTGGCELSLTLWDCVMSESAVRWGEPGRQGNPVRNTAGGIAEPAQTAWSEALEVKNLVAYLEGKGRPSHTPVF